VTGPAWLAGGLALLMLLVAVICAGRLALHRVRGRATELDADGLHVLMGIAMAGMLEPRLTLIPDAAWLVAFAVAAAWFTGQAIRSRVRGRPRGWRCAHPAPHAVECGAMLFMLRPAGLAGHGAAAAMPGMNAVGASPAAGNPALALVLALFMLGYLLWTADRLAAASRSRSAAGIRGESPQPLQARTPGTPGPAVAAPGLPAVRPALAPRLAACYKIAMSIGMGYMLVTML
jgi:hypothetical protein